MFGCVHVCLCMVVGGRVIDCVKCCVCVTGNVSVSVGVCMCVDACMFVYGARWLCD